MKKKLEAELLSIAHKILQLKDKADLKELKKLTGSLYEKILVLSYAEEHFSEAQPTLGKRQIAEILKEDPGEATARPDGTEYNDEQITEPNTEKIKNIVAQMEPEETDQDLKNIPSESTDEVQRLGIHYDDLPRFEPVSDNGSPKQETPTQKPATKNEGLSHQKQSLNDRLKKGIQIGLNDRLAYVKHLFNGEDADYNRVLSQLNTTHSYEEAKAFINRMVKPEYNHWEGKEELENRFLQAIENKFD